MTDVKKCQTVGFKGEKYGRDYKAIRCWKKPLKYCQKYTNECLCLQESSWRQNVFCTLCSRNVTISHGGREDCWKHITAMHKVC